MIPEFIYAKASDDLWHRISLVPNEDAGNAALQFDEECGLTEQDIVNGFVEVLPEGGGKHECFNDI